MLFSWTANPCISDHTGWGTVIVVAVPLHILQSLYTVPAVNCINGVNVGDGVGVCVGALVWVGVGVTSNADSISRTIPVGLE